MKSGSHLDPWAAAGQASKPPPPPSLPDASTPTPSSTNMIRAPVLYIVCIREYSVLDYENAVLPCIHELLS